MSSLTLSLSLALLFSIFHFHVSSSAQPRCHPEERSALLELNTVIWTLQGADCCAWAGITCDEVTGNVIGLSSLFWSISSITSNTSIFLLRRLQRLDLSSGGFRIDESAVKAISQNFTELEELNLSQNDMSSVKLVSLMNFSSSLTSLTLESCSLHGTIPSNFFHSFPNLEILDLSNNGLELLPNSISLTNFSSSLKHLEVASCSLRGELPSDFFHSFPKLEFLDFSSNNLSLRIPRSLFNLEHLNYLDLTNNNFSGQLPEFCSTSQKHFPSNCLKAKLPSNLKTLMMSKNSIGGPIPSWIYALPHLESLVLGRNHLSGEIGEFRSTSLTNLVLSDNKLRCVIPRSIFQQVKLEKLDLSSNNLTGTIHLDLASNNLASSSFKKSKNFTSVNMNLTFLDLSNNQLNGSVPKWLWGIGKDSLEHLNLSHNSFTYIDSLPWNKLDTLDLSYNLFSGALPILSSPRLTSFSVSNNRISREIPSSFCDLTSLAFLDLSSNDLSGEIPHCMGNFSQRVLYLDLKNNRFHGPVPLPWTQNNTVQYLDLRSNNFSGPLPVLSEDSGLFYSASNNRFSGEIPDSICKSKFLSTLDLAYNNLSGTVPQCIFNELQYLSVVDLRSNRLHGVIPETFPSGNALTSLNFNGNQLEGALPRSLLNCSNLEILDLGNNVLSDSFPNWLEALPKLKVLILRSNRFRGFIGNANNPESSFVNLRIMDLSHNGFTGALPTKYFENFKAMEMSNRNVNLSYVGEKNSYYEYYQDSVTVTMKGFEFELVRIQTIFTTIDFSSNNFTGEIPESLGKLEYLKGLNLSHNMLTGILPPSLGDLTNIEWLDLSSNELVGNIPVELADIPWLSFLNLSYNRLEGPIPRGSQFNTFRNESFEGNLNLCGFPMSKSCGEELPPEQSLDQDDEGDDDSINITNGFNWRIVMMGYGSGIVIGISIGYMLLYSNGKLHWLSETILEEIEFRRATRPKRRTNARRSPRRP